MALLCLDCGYSWEPRKTVTRYRRQCAQCDSYNAEERRDTSSVKDVEQKSDDTTIDGKSVSNLTWPKVLYNLMGVSGTSSPENALVRAFELYRHALLYKFKYKLESLEDVLKLLENRATQRYREDVEAEEQLQRILNDPKLIFKATRAGLITVSYYEATQKKGYEQGFLEFLNDVVTTYFMEHGFRSPEDFLKQR
jgi:hypothetical protein